ncbi:MAG: 4-(cytidine 5'-diphospho)-2-C-methyl-D-erythritol kinase [Puniceicoccales bacterium]|jgi:4-diphosphocytidyl-2-C-methyl-D-erythritol kinase|nr:4-(cytidine 5'-diphospho)-2-C-methyl-D-erythritol kinase [Puniceicoccales bacterium]
MHHSAFAPAKINLLLAITGARPDGFHSLVSLVAPIALGDTLHLTLNARDATAPTAPMPPQDTLACDYPGVPLDGTNLVLKAVAAFREKFPALPATHFVLEKRVPHGAGLGGGSSDAACALRLLNDATGHPLDAATLVALAARLGSDCPLFLDGKPVIMRGRGERIEPLTAPEADALRGRRLLLFKPAFGVSTAAAYGAMRASNGTDYIAEADAEARLAAWRTAPASAPLPLFNNMERPVFAKHLALPALLEQLRRDFALAPRMSGSGSACFAFLPDGTDAAATTAAIRAAWGESAFVCETALL